MLVVTFAPLDGAFVGDRSYAMRVVLIFETVGILLIGLSLWSERRR
jgi:hypothetical protein